MIHSATKALGDPCPCTRATKPNAALCITACLCAALFTSSCAFEQNESEDDSEPAAAQTAQFETAPSDAPATDEAPANSSSAEDKGVSDRSADAPVHKSPAEESVPTAPSPDQLRETLNITEDYRKSFVHGEKPADCQLYIMLHDTEGTSDAQSVINWWDSNGNLVAAHFVVNKDGSIWQCAPLDSIVHHAGFGDAGHNELYGTTDESRDDKKGTTSIGSWAPDYGMNSYSIGIEMVHAGGDGAYPEAQLDAVDHLIHYIDAYYGFESEIIDHKAWRTGNSDTSPEFAEHLASYQSTRRHATAIPVSVTTA